MINAGNPSAYNLKLRKMAAENKQSSAEIFKKLNKRGVLDPKQNAMSMQLTNEHLFRYYTKDTEPKLNKIKEQGENPIVKEIQRLIDVGNNNHSGATALSKANQAALITELQSNFSGLNDTVKDQSQLSRDMMEQFGLNAGGDAEDIKNALNDLNTNMETYNTTGTTNQAQLQATLTTLVAAIGNSNLSAEKQIEAILQLQAIMSGSAAGITLPGASATGTATTSGTTTPAVPAAAAASSAAASVVPSAVATGTATPVATAAGTGTPPATPAAFAALVSAALVSTGSMSPGGTLLTTVTVAPALLAAVAGGGAASTPTSPRAAGGGPAPSKGIEWAEFSGERLALTELVAKKGGKEPTPNEIQKTKMEKGAMVQVMKDIYTKYPSITKAFGAVSAFNAFSKEKYREKLEEVLTWRDKEERHNKFRSAIVDRTNRETKWFNTIILPAKFEETRKAREIVQEEKRLTKIDELTKKNQSASVTRLVLKTQEAFRRGKQNRADAAAAHEEAMAGPAGAAGARNRSASATGRSGSATGRSASATGGAAAGDRGRSPGTGASGGKGKGKGKGKDKDKGK